MKKILITLLVLFLNINLSFAQDADSILTKAISLIDKGELVEAENLMTKAIGEGVNTLALHHELAWVYYIQTDYDKAIKVLEPLCERRNLSMRS